MYSHFQCSGERPALPQAFDDLSTYSKSLVAAALQGTTDLSQDGRLVEDYYFEDDKENHGRHHG